MKPSYAQRFAAALAVTALGLAASAARATDVPVQLSGDQEVPPVKTAATGSGMFAIAADNTIAGSITTKSVAGTAAHIHEGEAGKNGAVIIPLTKGSNDTYSIPAGTKLSESQMAAFKAGKLYVNVHSSANPGGEIRAQLKP